MITASVLERILDTLAVVVLFGFYLVFFAQLYLPNSDRGRDVFLTVRRDAIIRQAGAIGPKAQGRFRAE